MSSTWTSCGSRFVTGPDTGEKEMGFRYTPGDLIRHSDFYEWYRSFSLNTQENIRQMVDGFIKENPSYRLSLLTGPGYFMMHWLMGD